MKQIRYIEWFHPDLYDGCPFGVNLACMLGLAYLGFTYDHVGD